MENKDTKNVGEKDRNIGLIVLSTAGIVGSVGLGVFCYQLSKENKALKIDKELYKDAYENLADKLTKIAETGEKVKRVVGGPLIDRLIKNEEIKLSRIDNKITHLLEKGMDEAKKKVLELKEERQQILETIAEFKDVKDSLK